MSGVQHRGQHLMDGQQIQPSRQSGALRIDILRKAIRANRVNFPAPVPVFPSGYRPDILRRVVELYFIHGWPSVRLATRYGVTARRIQQALQRWADRAVGQGYLQEIPVEIVLAPPARASDVPATAQSSPIPANAGSCRA
jgi:hypothetical protein